MTRDVKEHELASPVDLPGEPIERGDPLAWTTVTIAVAAIVLLFANAGTLAAWVDEKPVSQQQQKASELATGWKDAMASIGITAPRDALHVEWKKLQAKRFGEEAPAGMQ